MTHATNPTSSDETPRDTRVRLNRMERWLREHSAALTDAGHGPALVRLCGLFELAFKTEHADYLAAEIEGLGSPPPAPAAPAHADPRA